MLKYSPTSIIGMRNDCKLKTKSIFNFLLLHRLTSNQTADNRMIIYERTEDSKPLFLET